MAHIVTDGDYRFAPDGPGDNVIGCPECRTPPDVEGTYLWEEGGKDLRGASQLLPHPRRSVQPRLADAAGLPERRHLRRFRRPRFRAPAGARPAAAWPSPSGSPRATTRSRRGSPSTASGTTTSGGASFGRSTTWAGWAIRRPTPALLDWLAVEFMDRGWSVKELHRLLMTSEAYRMASAFPHEANAAADPENEPAVALPPAAHRGGDPARQHHDRQRRHRPDRRRTARLPAHPVRHPVPVGRQGLLVRQPGAGAADLRRRPPVSGARSRTARRSGAAASNVFRRRSLGFPFFDTPSTCRIRTRRRRRATSRPSRRRR